MKSIPTKFRVAALAAMLLAGCSNSDISAVKKMTVPEDPTHTNETALSGRAACESEEWRTFKDDTNRTLVEYRCDLRNGETLLAAFRQQKIRETQQDFQGYRAGLDRTAESLRQQNPEILEKQLADAQRQLAQIQANNAPARADTPEALKQAIVNRESTMEAATSAVKRAQRSLEDTRSDLTGVQLERVRFEQQEKEAITQIERTYGGITKATEVFQWFVRNDKIVPAWSGIEMSKQDGSTVRQDKNWPQTMQNVLRYRGNEHVNYALNIPLNLTTAAQIPVNEAQAMKPNDSDQKSGNQGQACYDSKLKDFRNGMGEEAPVSNDMMNEWRGQCGLPPT